MKELVTWLDDYFEIEDGKYGLLADNSRDILSTMMDRIYKKYEKLFKTSSPNKKIRFESTHKQRAVDTCDICKSIFFINFKQWN